MSLELLYTSATAGIRPGTRGFCTVLHTSGTPSNVISRLEGLSGYRHVFSPQSESDGRNPVGFSHLRFSVGGRPVSVVSRVAAYGVDYSGRTNKLAHHVVLEPHELPAAGPAWLLSQPGVMRTEWNGETATPISGPAIPSGDTPAEVCRRWESLTGDAGWGGVVAEALSNVRAKPLWIIHTLDQHPQMSDLIAESIAILPRQQRWLATFSTYYTNLPPEIDCRVRCVLADTEEARVAKTRGNVLDLTRELPVLTPRPYVERARSGRDAIDQEDDTRDYTTTSELNAEDAAGGIDDPYTTAPSSVAPAALPLQSGLAPIHSTTPLPPPPTKISGARRRRSVLWIAAASLLFIMATASYLTLARLLSSPEVTARNGAATDVVEPPVPTPADQDVEKIERELEALESDLKKLEVSVQKIDIPDSPPFPKVPDVNEPEIPDDTIKLLGSVLSAIAKRPPLDKFEEPGADFNELLQGDIERALDRLVDPGDGLLGQLTTEIAKLKRFQRSSGEYANFIEAVKPAKSALNKLGDEALDLKERLDATRDGLNEATAELATPTIESLESRYKDVLATRRKLEGNCKTVVTTEELPKASSVEDQLNRLTTSLKQVERISKQREGIREFVAKTKQDAAERRIAEHTMAIKLEELPNGDYRFHGSKEYAVPGVADAGLYEWYPPAEASNDADAAEASSDVDAAGPHKLVAPAGKAAGTTDVALGRNRISRAAVSITMPAKSGGEGESKQVTVKVGFNYVIGRGSERPEKWRNGDKILIACWDVVSNAENMKTSLTAIQHWSVPDIISGNDGSNNGDDMLRGTLTAIRSLVSKNWSAVDESCLDNLNGEFETLSNRIYEMEQARLRRDGVNPKGKKQMNLESCKRDVEQLLGDTKGYLKSKEGFLDGKALEIGSIVFRSSDEEQDKKRQSPMQYKPKPVGEIKIAPVIKLEVIGSGGR